MNCNEFLIFKWTFKSEFTNGKTTNYNNLFKEQIMLQYMHVSPIYLYLSQINHPKLENDSIRIVKYINERHKLKSLTSKFLLLYLTKKKKKTDCFFAVSHTRICGPVKLCGFCAIFRTFFTKQTFTHALSNFTYNPCIS